MLQAGLWGVAGFFIGGFIEEIALPLPSPVIFVGAKIFFVRPLSFVVLLKIFLLVILPLALGALLASLLVYGVCFKWGRKAVDYLSKWTRVTWTDVEAVRAKLSQGRSEEWTLFITRSIPFAPTKVFNIAAGILRMNTVRFTLIVLVANVIKFSILFFSISILGVTTIF